MEGKLPAPYPRMHIGPISPHSLRCDEIDKAAALITDPDAFAQAAKGDRVLSSEVSIHESGHAFLHKPNGPFRRNFTEEGGCPAFLGILNGGSSSNVLCSLTDVRLEGYCELKFCERGRKVYCPIWRAKGEKGDAE